jgi:hypothetical protein
MAFFHVKLVVPSESKQILYTPLHQFISHIKVSPPHDFQVSFFIDLSSEGTRWFDRWRRQISWYFLTTFFYFLLSSLPVYSVSPSSRLTYTIEKLLASKTRVVSSIYHLSPHSSFHLANAHRLFVTTDSCPSSPIPTSHTLSNLTGIVSIVDSMSHFTLIVVSFSCGPPLQFSQYLLGSLGSPTWTRRGCNDIDGHLPRPPIPRFLNGTFSGRGHPAWRACSESRVSRCPLPCLAQRSAGIISVLETPQHGIRCRVWRPTRGLRCP